MKEIEKLLLYLNVKASDQIKINMFELLDLLELIVNHLKSDEDRGCTDKYINQLTSEILEGLEPGQWDDNKRHIDKCLEDHRFYTKDDMISFAVYACDVAECEADEVTLKQWEE